MFLYTYIYTYVHIIINCIINISLKIFNHGHQYEKLDCIVCKASCIKFKINK